MPIRSLYTTSVGHIIINKVGATYPISLTSRDNIEINGAMIAITLFSFSQHVENKKTGALTGSRKVTQKYREDDEGRHSSYTNYGIYQRRRRKSANHR